MAGLFIVCIINHYFFIPNKKKPAIKAGYFLVFPETMKKLPGQMY